VKYKSVLYYLLQVGIIFSIIISSTNYSVAQGSNFPPGKNAYSVQMHLHGNSNHNAGDSPGSLQWHSFFADTSQTNVLWWSEHMNVYKQNKMAKFTFNNGIYHSNSDAITGLDGNFNRYPIKWQMENSGGVKGIFFNDTTLSVSIKATGTNMQKYTAHPIGVETKLKDLQYFVRPLVSNPIFRFYLKPVHLNNSGNNKIQLKITLDFHHYGGVSGSQNIIYNFVAPPAVYSEHLVDSFTVIVNYPVIPDTVNSISLDITHTARKLPDYRDNCTSDYLLAVYASHSDSVRAVFSKMEMYSTIPTPSFNYREINEIAKSYIQPYGVGEYVGTEYSALGQEQHINAFIPESLGNKYILYNDSGYSASTYVSRIHSFNGAASYNHPFGIDISYNPAFDSTEVDSFALIYLSNELFGADILEVGYVARGGFNMQQHFSLWDKLTANKVFVYGNGTSDAHGGNWYNSINHWCSFIWAVDSSTQNLITAMKTGRLYGADNLVYKGRFNFHVANAMMGDRVIADTALAPIMIDMDNVLPGSVFKYTQALIQNGLQVNYLHYNEMFDPANPPVVSLVQSCFIRIVVYDSTGKEYLFSNPVVFTDSLVADGNKEVNVYPSSLKLKIVYNEQGAKNEPTLFSDRDQEITLEVFDISGKLICKRTAMRVYTGNNNLTLACANLKPGMYVLKAFSNTGISGGSLIVPPTSSYIFKCND
jgi:hypothetical protein